MDMSICRRIASRRRPPREAPSQSRTKAARALGPREDGIAPPASCAARARAGAGSLGRSIRWRRLGPVLLAALLLVAGPLRAQSFITVASTTSTEQSGLFKHLLPQFERKHGIEVRVVALGTGQALELGRRGDADVLLVHAPALEEKFVTAGHAVARFEVMYNDFVVVGPSADPAGIGGTSDAPAALRRIKAAGAPFASRGDSSGTHFAEVGLWAAAGVDIEKEKAPWYRETGSGMGPTLNTASAMSAYTLTDRGTWLSFKNRGDLVVLVEGDREPRVVRTPRVKNRSFTPTVSPVNSSVCRGGFRSAMLYGFDISRRSRARDGAALRAA